MSEEQPSSDILITFSMWHPQIAEINDHGALHIQFAEVPITMRLTAVWALMDAIQTIGLEQATGLALFGLDMPAWFREIPVEAVAPLVQQTLAGALAALTPAGWTKTKRGEIIFSPPPGSVEIPGATDDDRLLGFCYQLLRNKSITRAQAAALASWVRQKPVTTAAWRMRVDRWAASQSLPKVGLRQRRGH